MDRTSARLAALLAGAFFISSSCSDSLLPRGESGSPQRSVEALFTNSGFETGNTSSWTVTTNLVATTPGVQVYPVTAESQLGLRTGGVLKTNVYDAGTPFSLVPPGLTAADPVRFPRFGNWAAVVNELGNQYNANRITQSSVVTTADIDPADGLVHVRFVVLPVLQNPGHSLREQPYYFVTITNTTKGTTLASRFNFSNEAGVPWQSTSNGQVVFTDWLLFDLPLSRSAVSIGDTLTATVIAGGCAQSGHWGEAIIDSFGSSIPGLVVYGSAPDSVEAGSDFQYTYRVLNGSSATATGAKLTAYLPAGVTFRSIDTPGITCTLPTVGTRGTVACDLGAIAVGASTNVKVTVRADATATGAIRHGWYYSQSNQEQPLTGPLITTNVTTGGTSAYVNLVTTVDDAAASVMWNQHVTWSITVRNAGPATATNAPISSNAPAQLTNLSWTCVGQSGGSCGAASGTGALSTLATLPSGGSVTYSLEADVILSTGIGAVSVTAFAAAPAGTVESAALDNGGGDDDSIAGTMQYVTVTRAGAGVGTITSTPAAISCGVGCTTTSSGFGVGTSVTLQATPGSGSVFAGFSGGTCSGTGACTFTVTSGQTVTATFDRNPIAITSPSTAKAAVGRPFSFTVTGLGTPPITFAATNLPAWLSFDAQTQVLSGTAPAAGTFTADLSATDVNGTATQTLTMTAGLAPTITSALTYTLAGATTAWGTIDVNASGATPIQFNASNMPGTVYFNSTTGLFAGNAGAVGVYNVPVIATNAFGSDYKVLAVSVGGAPVITSPLTASSTVGSSFTYTLTATGTATIVLGASSLPSWATFTAATGVITGTPTSAGTFSIGLSATNGVGSSSQTLVLTVDGPAVITSNLTASGTAGQAFTYSLTAEGTAPITRSMSGLPAWLSFDANAGLLSGTPPAAGTFTVTMGASNGVGSDSKTLTITIAAPPPTPTPPAITSALTASGTVGAAFSYTITASGQVPMTFSATGLPAWASVDANTGVISGTPSGGATTSVTIGATNALGADSKTLVISVEAPPQVTSALTATGQIGVPFSYTLTATGSGVITLTASNLPAWASFNAGTGVISGTPTADGSFSVSIAASNGAGTDSESLVITIETPALVTSALAVDGIVGDAFSYTVTASGSAPVSTSATGLPAWASFSAGVISGTPTAAGSFSITLGASNAAGSDSKTLTVTVRARPVITSALTADAIVGDAFSYTLTASGTAPVTLNAGSLPAWASFNAGVISGTPTAAGVVSISLSASNGVGSDAKTLVVTVRARPAITSALVASGVVGQAFSYTVTSSGSAPISLSATGLPAWASFNAGVISGTPTADGSFSITLGASNVAGSDSQTLVLTVRSVPAITSGLAVDAIVGDAFSYTLTSTGTAPVTLSASGLPAWASFNAGVISGTPTADGVVSISLGASNSVGSDSKTLVVTVRARPAITSALVVSGVVGQPFSYTLTASGTVPRTLSASGLPAWASFNAGTGVISGTPNAEGPSSISVGVSNAAGSDAQTLVLTVRSVPAITSGLAVDAIVGDAFSYTLTSTGTAPLTLSASGLPAWASFNAGVISGTPTADGVVSISLGASNSVGSDSKTLVVTVRARPAITSAASAAGVVGQPFSYTLTASGTAPVTRSVSGLPAWASFDSGSGVISGTPTADGSFTVALGASNAAGTASGSLVITVGSTPVITSPLAVDAVVAQAFSYSFTANGTAPLSLSVSGLPSWATFANGVISGVPDGEGVFSLTLVASNGSGVDQQTLVITARKAPLITSPRTAAAIVGQPMTYQLVSSGTAPLTFSATGLPSWASFDAQTGVLSGTPTAEGEAIITLRSSNVAGVDTAVLVIAVRTTPTITSALAVAAVVGDAFSYTLTASGTPLVVRSVTGLPSWLQFDSATGVLSGTPSGDGVFTIGLTATNGVGVDTKSLEVTVRSRPRITSALAIDAVVGDALVYALTLTGTEFITVQASSLPAWLDFDQNTRTLSGTPPAEGVTSIVFGASSLAGSDVKTLVITARARPVITNQLEVFAVAGSPFSFTLSATGTAPLSFSAGMLPAGLSLSGDTVSGTPTASGRFPVLERATNAAGFDERMLVISVRGVIPAPTIALPVEDAVLSSSLVTVSGSAPPAEAGNVVRVREGGQVLCDALILQDGSWSCPLTFGEGAHTLDAIIVDARGFEGLLHDGQRFVVDETAPAAPAWAGPGAGAIVSSATPPLSGTGEPNARVVVTFMEQVVCEAVVQPDGSWACTPQSPLPQGEVELRLTQRDAAGNRSVSVPRAFIVDSVTPVAPTIEAPMANTILRERTPTLRGTAEPGSTVIVSVDGHVECSTTADGAGQWSCVSSSLADGTHAVSVLSRDAAGNESVRVMNRFVVDLTRPEAPIIVGPSGLTTTTTPVISGRAEANTTVRVLLDGVEVCTAPVSAEGTWSCPAVEALAKGPHALVVTAKDAAGNESEPTTGAFDVQDATGAMVMPAASPDTDNPQLSGTATPGATVNVYVDGELVGSTTADANGAWTYDLPRLSAGAHGVSIGIKGTGEEESFRSPTQVLQVDKAAIDFGGGLGCSSTSQSPLAFFMLLGVLMLLRRRRAVAAVAIVSTAVVASAQGRVQSFEVEQLELNPAARGGLVVGGADLLQARDYRFSASFGYQNAPLQYFENGVRKATLIDHRLTAWFSGAYAITPWLEVGANLPVVVFQSGESARTRLGETIIAGVPASAAMGTPWLQARAAVMQERNGSPFDLGFTVMAGLPIGSVESLTKDPTVSGQLLVGAGRTFGPVRVALEAGAHLRQAASLVSSNPEDAIGSRVLMGGAVSSVRGPLRAELSVRGFAPLTNQPFSAEVLAGGRYAIRDWEVFAVAGPGFGNAPGTPAFRALVGVSFGGLSSAKCGGRSHVAAECPDLDWDGDGVPNDVDWCPELAVKGSSDGCPIPQVVTLPAPVAPVAPAGPPDADGDGVSDEDDACPDAAGEDANGCALVRPVETPVVEPAPTNAALKDGRIELKGTVYFETSRAELQPRSFPLLDEVASVMKAHPEVKVVRIEGHTDDRGGAAFNQPLSAARARAVKTYLEKAGIEPARLEAQGFGFSKPIAPNTTADGREQNRRVEFIVIE